MAAPPASTAAFGGRTGVRIVVAGDPGTGKSSMILTAVTESFPADAPHVSSPISLPDDLYPDSVPVTIIDTSASPEHRASLVSELTKADAIVLTYACDRPSTLQRLSSYWLSELRRLEVRVPVIVVGCKLDLRDEQQESLEHVMSPIMQQFKEIETCIECSALRQIQVLDVFYYAQKAVLHPTAPLFDQVTLSLKRRCVSALKRIFILCDNDRDGALSDDELNDFQVRCFNAPLQPSEIVGVKNVVQEKMPEGLNDNGLTLAGFLLLHALFIEKGRLETTWTVLRKFGYDNDLKIRDDLLPTSILKHVSDQSVELTNEAVDFLRGTFSMFDMDNDGALNSAELFELFSTAPENPWSEDPYKDAAEKNVLGGLSLEGFLSKWALMTLLDPSSSMANLIYIGYSSDPASAFHITRRRRLDRKRQLCNRNVLQCFVFGPKSSGKSALLNSLIGRTFSENYIPTTSEQFAANIVECPGGVKKTLVMREIPEDQVETLLSSRDSLAACDIAIFVHDSAAKHPHLSIPETEAGKNHKQYRRLINRSLMFVSVGAAAVVVGLSVYRAYASRKNSSA